MTCLDPIQPCTADADVGPVVDDLGPVLAPQPKPQPQALTEPQKNATDESRYLAADPDASLSTATASAEDVVAAITVLVEGAFKEQTGGAEAALLHLDHKEEPEKSWIASLVAAVAEMVVGFAFAELAEFLANVVFTSEAHRKLFGDKLDSLGETAAKSIGGALDADSSGSPMAGATSMLDAYRTEVRTELNARQTTGRARLVLSSNELAALSKADLGQMLDRLRATPKFLKALRNEQHDQVMLGWMRLCAKAQIGPRDAGKPEIPAANGVDENATSATTGVGVDGFVDIRVTCPSKLDGGNGCKVKTATVNSHPSAVDAIKQRSESLLALPLYRKVFLSVEGEAGSGFALPAYVLTPDGSIEVLPGAHLLAQLGGASGGSTEDGRWTTEQRTAVREYNKAVELGWAVQGATFVNDVLARTSMRDLK